VVVVVVVVDVVVVLVVVDGATGTGIGTGVTAGAPELTVSTTTRLRFTLVPAAGSWTATSPAGTVASARSIVVTPRCRRVSRAAATSAR
jgi:hypothetical protein